MSSFKQNFIENILPALQKKLGVNINAVPRLSKITINMGLGEALKDKKVLDAAVAELTAISGQKAQVTVARKSIAGFSIRDGYPIGCKVTLRGDRMYEFFQRLISVAIPRIRDFRGFSAKSFDKQGNYSLGIKEQLCFAEIDFDKVDAVRGMDIAITTTATNKEDGYHLLTAFGFPFKEKELYNAKEK